VRLFRALRSFLLSGINDDAERRFKARSSWVRESKRLIVHGINISGATPLLSMS
jgi:hypothetical protein